MRQHLCAVDAPPPERVVGQTVVQAPTDLRGHEVLHARTLDNLWQRPTVAEGIWQPQDRVVYAKLVAEELAPQHKLPHQRLAAGNVAVGLDPHPARWLPPSLLHTRLDLFVQVRRVLFDELVK